MDLAHSVWWIFATKFRESNGARAKDKVIYFEINWLLFGGYEIEKVLLFLSRGNSREVLAF